MQKERNIFLTAILFFTRIPVSKQLNYRKEYLNHATKYLPIIGWLAGGLAAGVFFLTHLLLPLPLAVLLSMVSTILLTGAFHEDGFSDVCDGFGGGWTQERILEIMKDSRVGAYGAIGTILLLLTKFIGLSSLEAHSIPWILITGHTVSRFATASFVNSHQYARADASSKSKPLGKKLKTGELIFATICIIPPLLLLPSWWYLMALPAVWITKYFFARYINKWIGGFTGDCLGATQQLTELAFYLSVLTIQQILNGQAQILNYMS